jgi:hypothetical protein
MNVTLIQNPEHDIDCDQGGQDQQGFMFQGALKGLRGALETPADARGQPQLMRHLPDRRHRFTEGPSRRKVERDRHRRKLALSADDQRHHGFGHPREDVQRHRPAAPAHFQLLQRLRPLLKFRHHLKNDAVLIQLREHGRDLPLTETHRRGVGDELRRDTHAGGGIAIDLHQRRQSLIELIAADIPQLRPYLQRSPAVSEPSDSVPQDRRLPTCIETGSG